jgi:hypothetical protein
MVHLALLRRGHAYYQSGFAPREKEPMMIHLRVWALVTKAGRAAGSLVPIVTIKYCSLSPTLAVVRSPFHCGVMPGPN